MFWVEGTAEPTDWTLNITDNTSGYQVPGGVGIWAYSTSTASSTAAVRFDNLVASIVRTN